MGKDPESLAIQAPIDQGCGVRYVHRGSLQERELFPSLPVYEDSTLSFKNSGRKYFRTCVVVAIGETKLP